MTKMIHINDLMKAYDQVSEDLGVFTQKYIDALTQFDHEVLCSMQLDLEMYRDMGGDSNIIDVCEDVSQGLESGVEFGMHQFYPKYMYDELTAMSTVLYDIREALLEGRAYC